MRVRTRWFLASSAAAALLAAGPAQAFGIVFNGPSGYGISAGSAEAAADAGIPIFSVPSISQAAALDLEIPEPEVLNFQLSSSPSVSKPNTANSRWTVSNGGERDLSGTWLVFLNPVTYTASKVGFEIDEEDGWAVVDVFVPMGSGGTHYFYPAVFLGNVAVDDSVTFLMHHLVGQALRHQGGKLVLPKYSVGALQTEVPEPAALVLLAAGAALAACAKRRIA